MASPSLDNIFKECPRFRILISGKTGVGKTTLIKETFNIDQLEESDKDRGKCDIEQEISSSQNDLFVLHDSQGFEAGEVDNFNTVKTFIDSRARMPEIKDRLHAVWLCIQIPHVDGRLIETGDEEFLKLPFDDLPVVIVFTQYDRLYHQFSYDLARSGELQNKTAEERNERIEQESERYFQKNCIEQLKSIKHQPKRMKWVKVSSRPNHRKTLKVLTDVTEELVRNHVRESAWVVMAAAQRVNADTKVKSCIAVGMQKYWRGLAAGTYFADRRLDACIGVIHQDIVGIWNFRDDEEILHRPSFMNVVLLLVQDLADPSGSSPGSDTIKNLEAIKAALGVATPISGPLAPLVASVGLSMMFAKWLSDMYNSTPGVLRCLMGYIVDITIVLEVLFWLKIAQPQRPSICEEDLIAAFNHYQGSVGHLEVHQQIRRYVDNMTLIDHINPNDNTHVEVERLINSHRRILVDTLTPGTKSDATPTAVSPPQNSPTPKTQPSSIPVVPTSKHEERGTDSHSEGSTPSKKKPKTSRFLRFWKK
ncbi:hypothetical protein M413DRAFT_443207 [Hebeloma cylindrosporum]|uniref:G domain-containing protein n=1 Tax=Hebeloma cylindrosporum TaxID=76867 RepID=A0A0C3CJB0_HEBCY|nr:hypothetical protein M413DRAFT_443207 [Hebeloma cylindrosporum h7]